MKKGFTLIELLAVIVILAIIALIATPIIIGLVDNARKESFESSTYGIVKAGEIFYAKNLLEGTNKEVTFTYNEDGETPSIEGEKLDYNGLKPNSGTVKINSKGKVALALHNGTYCAEKGYNDSEVTISDKTKEECIIIIWAWSHEDEDSNGTVSVGDKITFGTESFYVISFKDNEIKALAEYNLYVAGKYNADEAMYIEYTNATGLQNNTMKGYVNGQAVSNGTTPFSSDEIKGTDYSSYEGSIVEGYVNSYKAKLESLGATISSATLITKEELETLGCVEEDNRCISAPSFVYSTSYWSGSAYDADSVWFVDSDFSFNYYYYGTVLGFGVRPVITILSSEI